MDYNTPQGKDPQLWQLAQKRASFKSHLTTYIILNIFFWLLWFFNGSQRSGNGLPWPVWPMFGWGIGVAFHYISAYVDPRRNGTEKEYEKLMREKGNSSNQ